MREPGDCTLLGRRGPSKCEGRGDSETGYLVRGSVLSLSFVEPNKPNKPDRPDKPAPCHAPRNGFFISSVVLISQYSCLTKSPSFFGLESFSPLGQPLVPPHLAHNYTYYMLPGIDPARPVREFVFQGRDLFHFFDRKETLRFRNQVDAQKGVTYGHVWQECTAVSQAGDA
jgi:hypothetical protein